MAKKFDPIEEAKRTASGKPPAPIDPPTAAAPEIHATPQTTPAVVPRTLSAQDEFIKAVQIRAALKELPKKTLYRVLEDKLVKVYGHLVKFKRGDEIDPAGYGGEQGIEDLQKHGLQVEPIAPEV